MCIVGTGCDSHGAAKCVHVCLAAVMSCHNTESHTVNVPCSETKTTFVYLEKVYAHLWRLYKRINSFQSFLKNFPVTIRTICTNCLISPTFLCNIYILLNLFTFCICVKYFPPYNLLIYLPQHTDILSCECLLKYRC